MAATFAKWTVHLVTLHSGNPGLKTACWEVNLPSVTRQSLPVLRRGTHHKLANKDGQELADLYQHAGESQATPQSLAVLSVYSGTGERGSRGPPASAP